jgi:diadenosine tetraphosphate (Ap4A) HIT family hydrolase
MSRFNEIKENSKQQILWGGELFFCLFDGYPVSPGRCLVIPNREVKSLLDLTQKEWIKLKPFIERTIKALHKTCLI